MNLIVRGEQKISSFLQSAITFFFGVILTLTIILVVLRYIFNTSIIGGNELMELLFIYTTAIGAAISIGKREHIKVTYFIDFLPEGIRRVVDSFTLLLIAAINGVFFSLSFSWISKVGSAASPVLRIPSWIAMISVPIGCGLAVLFCLYDIFRVWNTKNGEAEA